MQSVKGENKMSADVEITPKILNHMFSKRLRKNTVILRSGIKITVIRDAETEEVFLMDDEEYKGIKFTVRDRLDMKLKLHSNEELMKRIQEIANEVEQ